MAQKSVIGWIIKKFKRCVAIVEDGDTASRAIAKGKYVMWKGNPYSASSAISSGDTLSLSNLTAKPDGFVNDLNSNTARKQWTYINTATIAGVGVSVNLSGYSELLLIMKNTSGGIRASTVAPTALLPNQINAFTFGDNSVQYVRLENGNTLYCGSATYPALLYAR